MRTLKAALFAAALAGATGAQAAEPSIWVQCDGLPKPEGAGTTAAKLGSVILTLGLSSFAFEGGGDPEYGEAGVRACTKALAEPGLAPFWGRHVSLLRSRALHAVEAGDLDSALKDLEATRAVSAGHVDDVAFNRSLGVSIKLFEAALLAKRGETDKAEALAFEAAAARPYSARVQGLSAALLGIDPAHGAAEDRILTRRAQLDPDALMARAAAREWSDPAGAADDWAAVVAVVRQLPPEGARLRESMEYVPGSAALLPYPLARAAVAAACAGRVGEVETMLNELEALRPWFPAKPPGKRDMAHAAEVRATSVAAIERTVPYRRLTRIWLATRAGRFDEARTLVNERVPAEPATFEVLGLIAKGLGRSPDPAAKGLEDLRKSVRTDRADALKVLQYAEALPLLEQVRKSTHRPESP